MGVDVDHPLMREVIGRIATGPHLSKDLSREQAREAMQLVLEQAVDPVQAAIFLIALRMKRETDDENAGVLAAIRDASEHCVADVDELVDLFDPYNGYIRSLSMVPFMPAVLAACGVASFSHGVETVGPKYGVTSQQVLAAAGIDVGLSVAAAAERVADNRIGWAYLPQSSFCPQLSDLTALRHKMVKRSVLTTVEGMAGALCGRRATHLITGYVHKDYPRIYLELARAAGYQSALVVRGGEGGIVPSLRQPAAVHRFYSEVSESAEIDPRQLGIEQAVRALAVSEELEVDDGMTMSAAQRRRLIEAVLDAGLHALSGGAGAARDSLVYGVALVLWHIGRDADLAQAARRAAQVLDDGSAAAHFAAAR